MEIKISDSEVMESLIVIESLIRILNKSRLVTEDSATVAKAIEFKAKLNKSFLQAGGSWS